MANFSLIHNNSSAMSQTSLSSTSSKLNTTLQRLSSGLRINKSGDDAAGLAIANQFRSDATILSQGVRNANDGLSTLQIIDGGLNTISGLLDRAASLASQSASGTFGGDRQTLQDEVDKVMAEITRQSSNIGLNAQVGAGTGAARYSDDIEVYIGGGATAAATGNVVTVDLDGTDVSAAGLSVGSVDLTSAANAKTAVAAIKAAVGTLGEVQGKVGAGQNNLSQAIDLATAQITNFQAAESSIRDADIAAEASNMARLSTLQQAGVSALAQANQSSQALLSLLR